MVGPRRSRAVGAIVALALLTMAVTASAAGGTTRYVDGDGHASAGNCDGSGHAFQHIQAAVNASGHNDTVIVCPGTYQEQVVIEGDRDGLTLRSSREFKATIKTPPSLSEGDVGGTVLVLVNRTDDVTIQGFKLVTRTQAPCDILDATIAAAGSRRTAIRGNRLLAPGASATADCYQTEGIIVIDYASDPSVARSSSATVGFNEVRDTLLYGIGAGGTLREVTADVVHNSVRAYFGASPSAASSALARASRLAPALRQIRTRGATGAPQALPTDAGYYGIAMLYRIKGQVRDNIVQGATSGPTGGPFFYYGIVFGDAPAPTTVNGPISVHDNLVRRVLYGIVGDFATDVTVRDNTVTNAYAGMVNAYITDSHFRRNTVTAKQFGVQVDPNSTSNIFKSNTFDGNGGTCKDDSVGGGTAGTANTWTGNTATVGDSPNGICPTP